MHYLVKERVQREIENHEHNFNMMMIMIHHDHMSLQQHIEKLIIYVLNIRIIRTFIMVRVEEKCRFCSVEGFIPNNIPPLRLSLWSIKIHVIQLLIDILVYFQFF